MQDRDTGPRHDDTRQYLIICFAIHLLQPPQARIIRGIGEGAKPELITN